jgi:imidazolonepropionase-like amidohydrolase
VERPGLKRTLSLVRLAWLLVALGLSGGPVVARELVIENVTVVSAERSEPMRDVTVSVRDGRIASIRHSSSEQAAHSAQDRELIDGRGLYLSPGLIDSHVHTAQVHGMTPQHEAAHPDIARAARAQNPRSYLYFGFTTLIDLVSTPEAIDRWNRQPEHPDIYFCGATPIVDGYPMVWAPKPERYGQFPYLIVQRGEEATAPEGIDPVAHTPDAVVERMKRDGASCVKTFYERGESGQWPTPRLDTIRALVDAAHKAQLPVLIHATSTEAQEFALDAGVDIIAHGLWSWTGEPGTSELTPRVTKVLNRIVKAKVAWQPTMQVSYGFRDMFDPDYLADPQLTRVLPASLIAWYRTPEGRWFHDTIARSLPKETLHGSAADQWQKVRGFYEETLARTANVTHYLARHQARLLFATDTPSSPLYTNPPGLSGWREINRLVEAGVTPGAVFRAATLANAEAMGLGSEIGTVQVGKRANLLLLREDPTRTIQAYDEIVKVVLHGRVLERSALAASVSSSTKRRTP